MRVPRLLIIWDEEGNEKKPDKLFEKLEGYCNPRKIEALESHRFWNVQYQEPFDNFLTELRTRASSCNFDNKDRMIRDKIVFTVQGKLQDTLSLDKAIQICRAYEQSNKHVKELRENNSDSHAINKVTDENKQPKRFQDKPVLTTSSTLHKECRFCGYKHENKKEKCPAWGKTCNACKGRNHFKSKCKKGNVNSVSALDDSDDDCWLNPIDAVSEKSISVVEANVDRKVKALMNVNDCEVRFQRVNTICKKFVRKDQVRPTSITLRMWNKTPMKPLGEANLTVKKPSTGDERIVTLIVVPNGHANLLSFKTV